MKAMYIREWRVLLLCGLLEVASIYPALAQAGNQDEIRCPRVCGCGGVLNDVAVEMPAPVYPAKAKRRGVAGTVIVFVIVDEEGRVSKARACFGPRELRRPAEEAAYKARIRPTVLSGVAVKVRGVLTYTFPPKEKGRDPEAAPNMGMHPTRFSVAFIRQLESLIHCVRAGDAGR